ncbi:MAG TPA: rhodanese-like domain-containing protein [Candidatus Hydrogenedentes bacterium]|nr:rhodanese-like domain-containing protein [Candidatus Hydrogenedentota bacterium]
MMANCARLLLVLPGLAVVCLGLVGCPSNGVPDADLAVSGLPGMLRIAEVRSSYVNILPDEVKLKLDAHEDFTLIDVRPSSDYQRGHLPGAVSMPIATLPWTMNRLDKDKETVVYCQSGITSVAACNVLIAGGFSDVKNMVGGIGAWPFEVVTSNTVVVSL